MERLFTVKIKVRNQIANKIDISKKSITRDILAKADAEAKVLEIQYQLGLYHLGLSHFFPSFAQITLCWLMLRIIVFSVRDKHKYN